MRGEFDKRAEENTMYGSDRWTAIVVWQHYQQQEIDALKAEIAELKKCCEITGAVND